MQKPTIAEIQEYIDEKHHNVDAEGFYLYQEARGWKAKAGPIVCWKSSVGYCARMGYCKTPASSNRQAKLNVNTAKAEHKHQRELYQSSFEQMPRSELAEMLQTTIEADARGKRNNVSHVKWLMREILEAENAVMQFPLETDDLLKTPDYDKVDTNAEVNRQRKGLGL